MQEIEEVDFDNVDTQNEQEKQLITEENKQVSERLVEESQKEEERAKEAENLNKCFFFIGKVALVVSLLLFLVLFLSFQAIIYQPFRTK